MKGQSVANQLIVLDMIKENSELSSYIESADRFIGIIGFTEHGFRHANLVSSIARNVLLRLGYPERMAELAAIAGYLHDIGNMAGRTGHTISGAMISMNALREMGMDPEELAVVVNAIGAHEEEDTGGWATSEVSAALMLADKSDVHHTRVRNPDKVTFDIHDRVNYAAKRSFLRVDEPSRTVSLEIDIDTEISQVMEYFEIFLSRMVLCSRAAEFLNCKFSLVINNTKLL
ncbi:MAG: HD domain-containing protein [Actinobacteria bacterium]|nr:MAG: HD domain-containing protein [Actinomycetota bacterium]